MSLEQLIDSYGYIAVLIGTFLEGETILVLGGIASKLGYLEFPWVIACAFIGTLFGDQLFFFLGRNRLSCSWPSAPAPWISNCVSSFVIS